MQMATNGLYQKQNIQKCTVGNTQRSDMILNVNGYRNEYTHVESKETRVN